MTKLAKKKFYKVKKRKENEKWPEGSKKFRVRIDMSEDEIKLFKNICEEYNITGRQFIKKALEIIIECDK